MIGLVLLGCFAIPGCALLRRLTRERVFALSCERYRQLFALSKELLFDYDYERDQLSIPPAEAHRLGLSLPRQKPRAALQHGWDGASPLTRALFDLIAARQDGQLERAFDTPNGSRTLLLETRVVRDHLGRARYCIGRIREVREDQTPPKQRGIDSLTGLYTTDTFLELAGRILSALPAEEQAAVIWFGADPPGSPPDTRLLAAISSALRACFRTGDLLGQAEDGAFCVLLRNITGPQIPLIKQQQLGLQLARLCEAEALAPATLSMGAATCKGPANADILCRSAAGALARAQQRGGGRYELV